MEVNEAPEKIYLLKSQDRILDRWYNEQPIPKTFEQVEYIRTDAFIDKACEWLSDNLQTIRDVDSPSKHHVETIPVLGSITQTEFLEKFKKEIKYLFD